MAYKSQEGYDKLVADLHHLEAIERPKASAAIAEAADKGDLCEISEYDAAKEAQVHLAQGDSPWVMLPEKRFSPHPLLTDNYEDKTLN